MIKVGDILKTKKQSWSQKVLAICGDVYGISYIDKFDDFGCWKTLKELEENFDLPKEKWEPTKFKQNYWFIDSWGKPANTVFTADSDEKRVMFGNCFQTKAEAELARDKIREVLKGE
jgi:hypothetical protein